MKHKLYTSFVPKKYCAYIIFSYKGDSFNLKEAVTNNVGNNRYFSGINVLNKYMDKFELRYKYLSGHNHVIVKYMCNPESYHKFTITDIIDGKWPGFHTQKALSAAMRLSESDVDLFNEIFEEIYSNIIYHGGTH